MTTPQQPSAGAVKLAKVIAKGKFAPLEKAFIVQDIDLHVAPLVEALETTIRRFRDEKDFEEDCDYQDILAALQQWKDGKG